MELKSKLPRYSLVLLLSFCVVNVYSQDAEIKAFQTVHSPQTNDLGSAVFSQVSMYTGKPSINLPIYTIKHYDLEVPLALSYDAGGFIPSKAPSVTGLNWSVVAGGVITRNVNHIPDESFQSGSGAGFYTGFFNRDTLYTNSEVLDVADHLNGNFYKHLFELSPDLFIFNFGNHSGKFMMGQDSLFHVQGDSNFKIDVQLGGFQQGGFTPAIYTGKITMTDDSGIKYEFGGSFSTSEYSAINADDFLHGVPNAWYLVKITSPEGHTIDFNYAGNHGTAGGLLRANSDYTKIALDNSDYQTVKNVYLRSIECKTRTGAVVQTVVFENEMNTTSFSVYANEHLKKIYVKDDSLNTRKTFEFTYDYITYEGGAGARGRNLLTSFGEYGLPKYTFTYYNDGNLSSAVPGANKTDFWGFFNNLNKDVPIIPTPTYIYPSLQMSSHHPQWAPNAGYTKSGILGTITSPTKGITEYLYESNKYRTTYELNAVGWTAAVMNADSVGGGLRVSKINMKEGSTVLQSREYKYVENYIPTGSGLVSSGIVTRKPQLYRWNFITPPEMSSIGESPLYYSEVVEIFDGGGYKIHKFTSDEYPDRAYVDGTTPAPYKVNYSGSLCNDLSDYDVINFYKKRSSTALERGKPSLITTYDSLGVRLSSSEYVYNVDVNRYNNKIAAIDFPVKGIDPTQLICAGITELYTTSEYYYFNTKLTKQEDTWYNSAGTTATLVTTTRFDYNGNRQTQRKTTIKSNGTEDIEKYKYVGDYVFSGGSHPVKQMQDLHIIAPLVEQQKLQKISSTTTLLAGNLTTFAKWNSADIFRPDSVKQLALASPSSDTTMSYIASNNLVVNPGYTGVIPEVVFTAYTLDGKTREFHPKGQASSVTYIWSYAGQQPVAEIRNGTFAEAQTAVGSTNLTNLEASLSPNITSLSSTLRTSLGSASVNSYSYDLYAGVKDMIDPKGKVTTYVYDAFERLKHIKDQNGNILKSFDYHFKE